jgi:hypothetical protein
MTCLFPYFSRPAFEKWSDFWGFDSRFNDAILSMPSESVSRRTLFIYRAVVLVFFVVWHVNVLSSLASMQPLNQFNLVYCATMLPFFALSLGSYSFMCHVSPRTGQLYRRSNLQQMGRQYGAELFLPHAVDVCHGECVFSALGHRHDARSRRTGANSILWKFYISTFSMRPFLLLAIIVPFFFFAFSYSLDWYSRSSDPSLSSFAQLHPSITRTHSLSSSTCCTSSRC